MSWKRPPARVRQYEGADPSAPRATVRSTSPVLAALDDRPTAVIEPPPAPPTSAERAYMGRVAALGCLICRRMGAGKIAAEVHHVREGQGGAQRAPSYLTVPLCPEHHRGSTGIHGLGPRAFERRYRVDELGLLAETISELCR